jgi:hypothetical protein
MPLREQLVSETEPLGVAAPLIFDTGLS